MGQLVLDASPRGDDLVLEGSIRAQRVRIDVDLPLEVGRESAP